MGFTAMSTRYVVVDLEATCWEGPAPFPNEIIEIGAVALTTGAALERPGFQRFVRPVLGGGLSAFCTSLTSITQQQVDGAPGFATALEAFVNWAAVGGAYTLASWGSYDWRQLRQDCERAKLAFPFARHLNVRRAYTAVLGRRGRPEGLEEALTHLQLTPEGVPHRALDDAINAARVLQLLLGRSSPDDLHAAAGTDA